MNGVVVMQYDT